MHFFHGVAFCVTSPYMFGKSDTWRSVTAAVHQRASGKKWQPNPHSFKYVTLWKRRQSWQNPGRYRVNFWAEQAIAQNSEIPLVRVVIAALENRLALLRQVSWWVWSNSTQKSILLSPRAGATPGHSWSSSPSHCHCPTLTSHGSSSLIPMSSPVSPTHHNIKTYLPHTSEKPRPGLRCTGVQHTGNATGSLLLTSYTTASTHHF